MPRKPDDTAGALRALEAADCAALAAALRTRFRLVARAATLAGERLCYDQEGDLIAAFRRLAGQDHRADPGCHAKGAIARALLALDCLDAGFWRDALALTQPEPVWGGRIDTAADLRASAALGLAASGDRRALIDLVTLLGDPQSQARAGAARALALIEPLTAEALLRLKVQQGDPTPEVLGEALRALLAVAPDTAPTFVATRLDGADPVLAELAALALGESRLDAAVALLRARWEVEPLKRPAHRIWLKGAVLARTEAAFDWLFDLVTTADAATAAWLVEELAIYRNNRILAARLAAAQAARGATRP